MDEFRERRSATRPQAGDLAPCPHCGRIRRFEERVVPIEGGLVRDPVWACLNPQCRHEERPRQVSEGTAATLILIPKTVTDRQGLHGGIVCERCARELEVTQIVRFHGESLCAECVALAFE